MTAEKVFLTKNGIFWIYPEKLGFLPDIICRNDQPIREQVEERYAHGGGYRELEGFVPYDLKQPLMRSTLQFPGDPPLHFVGAALLENELFIVFDSAFCVILQKGTWAQQIIRMD